MYAAVAAMPCYVAPSSPVLKVAATGMPQRCNGPFCTHVNSIATPVTKAKLHEIELLKHSSSITSTPTMAGLCRHNKRKNDPFVFDDQTGTPTAAAGAIAASVSQGEENVQDGQEMVVFLGVSAPALPGADASG